MPPSMIRDEYWCLVVCDAILSGKGVANVSDGPPATSTFIVKQGLSNLKVEVADSSTY